MTERTYGLTQALGHGHAFTQNLRVPAPAAGVGFTYMNDGRYWQLIDALAFKIVTDSNAANRVVTMTVADASGAALATIVTPAALTASKTGFYSYVWNFSANTGATDGPFLATMPRVFLQPSFTITVALGGVQVGDQVSNIRLQAEQFVTGDAGYLLGVVDELKLADRRVVAAELLA